MDDKDDGGDGAVMTTIIMIMMTITKRMLLSIYRPHVIQC